MCEGVCKAGRLATEQAGMRGRVGGRVMERGWDDWEIKEGASMRVRDEAYDGETVEGG